MPLQLIQDLAIYIHFPFCLSKCGYCAFYSVVFDQSLYASVVDKIISDISTSKSILGARNVISIFFGGGTPPLMNPTDIDRIINAVSANYHVNKDVEITLESNPDTLNKDNLALFKCAGVNRISIGCQSLLDNELQFLGRRCNAAGTERALSLVCDEFENFNIDLIYGFPIQTENSLKYSLAKALSFSPTHMSCYKLTFEPNTALYNKLQAGQISDITEGQDLRMFELLVSTLERNGFTRYEISNFAKRGFECRHNYMYWNYEDYLGIGAAAHSRVTIDGIKHSIEYPRDTRKWLKSTAFPLVELSDDEACEEAIIMGLRTINGVDEKYFKNIIKSPKFTELLKNNVIYRKNNRIALNAKYMNLCDYVSSVLV